MVNLGLSHLGAEYISVWSQQRSRRRSLTALHTSSHLDALEEASQLLLLMTETTASLDRGATLKQLHQLVGRKN